VLLVALRVSFPLAEVVHSLVIEPYLAVPIAHHEKGVVMERVCDHVLIHVVAQVPSNPAGCSCNALSSMKQREAVHEADDVCATVVVWRPEAGGASALAREKAVVRWHPEIDHSSARIRS